MRILISLFQQKTKKQAEQYPLFFNLLFALGLLGLGVTSAVYAATPRYVGLSGSDNSDCSSQVVPCLTITYALNQAIEGDTINIAAGTYFENLTINKDVTLQGAGQGMTILDGNAADSVVTVNADDLFVNIAGLSIINGAGYHGGGIYSPHTVNMNVTNSSISGNTASVLGGGILMGSNSSSTLVLTNSNISENSAILGGGVYASGDTFGNAISTVRVINSTINDNSAGSGGGIYTDVDEFGDKTVTVTVINSTISNNLVSNNGGGINNFSNTLEIINSTVSHNSAGNNGGGIYSTWMVTITNSIISSNSTVDVVGNTGNHSGNGGGVFNDGYMTLTGSLVENNHASNGRDGGGSGGDPGGNGGNGGGIFNSGTLSLTNSTIRDNSAGNGGEGFEGQGNGGDGGGILNLGIVTLTNSTLRNNRAGDGGLYQFNIAGGYGGNGGGIFNVGSLEATNSTVKDNVAGRGGVGGNGGGILNEGVLTLNYTTISGNQAGLTTLAATGGGGGGILNYGNVSLTNSTVSGNQAGEGNLQGGWGGGISGNFVSLINSTVSGNRAGTGPISDGYGGGIYPGNNVFLINTIVANNSLGGDCSGQVTSNGHNLDSDGTCITDGFNGDMTNSNPMLGSLQDNGGPTQTHALLPGSPATDKGDDSVIAPPLSLMTDQRGLPRFQCSHVDIGAYEAVGASNDFNGDCKSDLGFFEPIDNTVHVALSTGDEFGEDEVWVDSNHFGQLHSRHYVGDFNGDGKADLGFFDTLGNSFRVTLSTGSGFGGVGSGIWIHSNGFGHTGGRHYVGDFDGDGKDDLAFAQPGVHGVDITAIHITLSTGSSFGKEGSGIWTDSDGFGHRRGRHFVGDFNGDGKSDLGFFDPVDNTFHVALSDGSGFGPDIVWIGSNGFGHQGGRHYVGDFNGDGKDDLAFAQPGVQGFDKIAIPVTLSTGSGFGAIGSGIWSNANGFGHRRGRHFVADFNGDGKGDFGFFDPVDNTFHVTLSNGINGFAEDDIWIVSRNSFIHASGRFLFANDPYGNEVGRPR